VNADIERGKFVAWINQRFVGKKFLPVHETDDTDLTDAADTRASCFHVDNDEIGREHGI
jgi:hypothetical protein